MYHKSKGLIIKKLNCALIGLGAQGFNHFYQGLIKSNQINLKAVSDMNPLNLEKVKDNILKTQNYKDVFSQELDFVVLALPHNAYTDVIQEAFLHKVHVLKEKPFACDIQEAFLYKRIASTSNLVLNSLPQRRFFDHYRSLSNQLSLLGKIFCINITYNLFISDVSEGWRGSRNIAKGGCILDMGYHMIDFLVWKFGLPQSIYATCSGQAMPEASYDCEDTANIIFSYESGLHGTIFLSRYCQPKNEKILILGSKGSLEIQKNRLILRQASCPNEIITEIPPVENCTIALEQISYFCRLMEDAALNEQILKEQINTVSFIQACYDSYEKKQPINPYHYFENKDIHHVNISNQRRESGCCDF